MYLAPSGRSAAFSELARVVKRGGYLVTAFKAGDSQVRRGGHSTGLGIEFDVYWLSPGEVERRVIDARFAPCSGADATPRGRKVPRRGICSPRGPEAHQWPRTVPLSSLADRLTTRLRQNRTLSVSCRVQDMWHRMEPLISGCPGVPMAAHA